MSQRSAASATASETLVRASSDGVARHGTDVGRSRERLRRRRLGGLASLLAIPLAYLVWRIASGSPLDVLNLDLPTVDPITLTAVVFFAVLIFVMLGTTVVAGRSPHVMYRPEQIDVTLDDVKGIEPVKEDVVRSLNLFLAHRSFATEMGGAPRRGLLFEGAAGHRQDAHGQGDGRRGRSAVPVRLGDVVPVDVLRRYVAQDPLLLQGPAQSCPQGGRRDRVYRGDRRDRGGPRGHERHCDARGGALERHLLRWSRGAAHAGVRRRRHRGELHGQRRRRRGRQRAARPDAVVRRAHGRPEAARQAGRCAQPVPARAPPAAPPDAAVDQRARDRGHQPRRQPRPRTAAPGPLRPAARVRRARPYRPARARRPLPGTQSARGRARRGRGPRPDRRGDPGLHAGDDRAPLRRGARERGAPWQRGHVADTTSSRPAWSRRSG